MRQDGHRGPAELHDEDRLSPSELATLRRIVATGDPPALALVDDVMNRRLLHPVELARLTRLTERLFLDSLDAESEPNAEGAVADGLTGRLQPYGEDWHRANSR